MKSTILQLRKSTLLFTFGTALLAFGGATAKTNANGLTPGVQTSMTVEDSTRVKADASVATSSEQMIASDLQVIESEILTVAPLLPGKTFEEVIQDDARIIDGETLKVYPLDFKKINQQKKPLKVNGKRLIGSL